MLKRILLCLPMLTVPAWSAADEPAGETGEAAAAAEQAPAAASEQAPAQAAAGAEEQAGPRTMSGMSILGNEEAPKALVIVPWKTSELGADLDLSDTLDDRARPVDRDVFMRELDYYTLRSGEPHGPAGEAENP
ncbi:MAG TPA: hypothetical protein VF329_07355 [Gammaproteobacteria bacterium]